MGNVLVTGGAGYIGAHVVRALQDRGDSVIVVDDLSSGMGTRIRDSHIVVMDLSDSSAEAKLIDVLVEHRVDAVIHVAGRKQVGESLQKPTWYYQQNVSSMTNVLFAMESAQVKRLVFSSSAAVYGSSDIEFVGESTRCAPINPYGETKLVGEWMTKNASRAWGLRVANLRYFNVAGAGQPDLGDRAALNLIPIVFDRLQRGEQPVVFGSDYGTADGTCVRDYVHVSDLADAHISALDYLNLNSRQHTDFNVGTGKGATVLEVLKEIGSVSGRDATPEFASRRMGDPPRLIADVSRIRTTLGWTARRGLHEIVSSAWEARQSPIFT